MFNHDFSRIQTLAALNVALPTLALTDAVTGAAIAFAPAISAATFTAPNLVQTPGLAAIPGTSVAMLDRVIAADGTNLWIGMTYMEIIDAIAAALPAMIDTFQPGYTYDVHGEKHFPGGPAGTKFATPLNIASTSVKPAVNRLIEGLIRPEIGRIRRDANGANRTYYYTVNSNNTNPRDNTTGKTLHDYLAYQQGGSRQMQYYPLAIQVDYTALPEAIKFHGYPDSGVTAYALSRSKNGPAIP